MEFRRQIGTNQWGATLGAEDDMCKQMTEGSTILYRPITGA
jgi:hypothetical protein